MCAEYISSSPQFEISLLPFHSIPSSVVHIGEVEAVAMLSTRLLSRRFAAVTSRRWQHTTSSHQHPPLNPVTSEDIAHFSKILPPHAILTTLSPSSLPPSELEPYNNDWMGKYHGQASTVLRPQTTQQVSDIMKWCYERRIGVVPQGGNTGLVGGSVPLGRELVVSLGGMNKVRSFDTVSGESVLAFALCFWELF